MGWVKVYQGGLAFVQFVRLKINRGKIPRKKKFLSAELDLFGTFADRTVLRVKHFIASVQGLAHSLHVPCIRFGFVSSVFFPLRFGVTHRTFLMSFRSADGRSFAPPDEPANNIRPDCLINLKNHVLKEIVNHRLENLDLVSDITFSSKICGSAYSMWRKE